MPEPDHGAAGANQTFVDAGGVDEESGEELERRLRRLHELSRGGGRRPLGNNWPRRA